MPRNNGTVVCNLVVLRSRDLEWAHSFYGALGLEFVRHSHGSGPVHLTCESGGHVFKNYPLTDEAIPTTSTRVGFSVPSVDAVYDKLIASGGRSVSRPKPSEWGRRAVVADPDGHRVEISERL
jgi:lactoylglutathione lyase